jgi:hypothetical protein
VCTYKTSDPPPPALSHFFVPDSPPSLSCPPPPPPPSSYPTAASAAPPVLYPTGFSTVAGLPKSADTLTPCHAAGPPPSAPGTRATSSPTCLRPPRPPGLRRRRAGLLPTLPPGVLSIVASSCTVVLPNAAGSAAPPRTLTLPLVLPNWVFLFNFV